ncbi:MAG: DUF4303 domain-containing protein [Planctomycetota bacterium]
MSAKRIGKATLVRLADAAAKDARDYWNLLREKAPSDRIYLFGLVSDDVGRSFGITARGESDSQSDRNGDPEFRWSPFESYWCELSPQTDRAEAILGGLPDPYDHADGDIVDANAAAIHSTLVDVLRGLDREGLFGQGDQRRNLTLGLYFGDQSYASRLEFIEQLNPPGVAERYRRDLGLAYDKSSIRRYGERRRTVHDLSLSADLRRFGVLSEGKLDLFDVAGGELSSGPTLRVETGARHAALSRDGSRVALVTSDDDVQLQATVPRAKRTLLKPATGRLHRIAWLPDDGGILCSGTDASALLLPDGTVAWRTRDFTWASMPSGGNHAVARLADGSVVAAVESCTGRYAILPGSRWGAASITADGQRIAVAGYCESVDQIETPVTMWDGEEVAWRLSVKAKGASHLAFSPDGSRLVLSALSATGGTTLLLVDADRGRLLAEYGSPIEPSRLVVIDAHRVAGCGHDTATYGGPPLTVWHTP